MARTELVRARVRGAARTAAGLRGARRAIQNELNAVMRGLARRAQEIYSHPAPVPSRRGSATLRDTGRALDSVQAAVSFRASSVRVRVTIQAQRDGFNYLDAMRFGQTTDPILPHRYGNGQRGFVSAHLAGRDRPPTRLRSVRAFRPMVDFVEESHVRFAPEVDRAEDEILRTVDAVFVATR